jgi:hypothetical protein
VCELTDDDDDETIVEAATTTSVLDDKQPEGALHCVERVVTTNFLRATRKRANTTNKQQLDDNTYRVFAAS